MLISGFENLDDKEAVISECEHLAGANDLCLDLEKLRTRLRGGPNDQAWKVLEADDNNNFAVAVPLCVQSSFRSAPRTCKVNEHALVMYRPGLLRTYPTGHSYTNNYTIIPLTKGPRWVTDSELYDAPIAAVFRVTALLEAELGLFQLLFFV